VARLIELDPRYCDVIVQRWQQATGATAVLDGKELTFGDRKAERHAA
jgi:hypothetical protein